jgi:acyl carrier protein
VPGKNAIVAAIDAIIRDKLELSADATNVGPETPLFDGGLGLDSFNIVELIAELEEQFSFEFDEDDFTEEHFRTIASLGSLVDSYLNAKLPRVME